MVILRRINRQRNTRRYTPWKKGKQEQQGNQDIYKADQEGKNKTENEKKIPEPIAIEPLTEDQLDKISGGVARLGVTNVQYKRCSADPTHVYPAGLGACPVCGAK